MFFLIPYKNTINWQRRSQFVFSIGLGVLWDIEEHHFKHGYNSYHYILVYIVG